MTTLHVLPIDVKPYGFQITSAFSEINHNEETLK